VSKKIAVAIIHGAGSQQADFAEPVIAKLTAAFLDHLPDADQSVANKLVFRPIYWANVLAKKQRVLWNTLETDGQLDFKAVRKFLMHFGADAVAYQPSASHREVYDNIHQIVTNVLSDLAKKAGPQAPLCIIGHSIGTVITHNYFYDLGYTDAAKNPIINTPLEKGKTLTFLYTMGSPLAFWSLRYNNYKPIIFPGTEVNNLYPGLNPEWVNFYDKDDILGYPIRSLSSGHKKLAEQGYLEDIQVDSGNILTSWTPLSHLQYWTDNDVIQPIAKSLAKAWQTINTTSTPAGST